MTHCLAHYVRNESIYSSSTDAEYYSFLLYLLKMLMPFWFNADILPAVVNSGKWAMGCLVVSHSFGYINHHSRGDVGVT